MKGVEHSLLNLHLLDRSKIFIDLLEDRDDCFIVCDICCVGKRLHAFVLYSCFCFMESVEIEVNDCNVGARFRQCNRGRLSNTYDRPISLIKELGFCGEIADLWQRQLSLRLYPY